jgi:hypothetical protein
VRASERPTATARRILARLVFAALLAASALTACSLITSYDGLEGAAKVDASTPPPPVEASVADVVVEAAPADPCASEGTPPPPDGGAVTGDVGRLVAAVRTVRLLGDGDGGPTFGLNMDRTCGASCVSSAASPPVDPPSGIDNAAFGLFQTLKALGNNVGDVSFNDGIKAGLWSLVVRVDGYAGTADDDAVQVDLLNAVAVNKGDAGARLDGTDEWIIDSTSMVAGVSLFRSKVAYVSGDVLVARFDRFPPAIRFSAGAGVVLGLSPELFAVTLTARIVSHAGGALTLADAKLVGAMPPEQFLLTLQRLGICSFDPVFPTAVDYVCGVRDLAPTLTSPVTDKCTNISFAIAFDAIPASVAASTMNANTQRGCDGGNPAIGCGSR